MQGRLGEAWEVVRLAPAAHDCWLRKLNLDGNLGSIHENNACLQLFGALQENDQSAVLPLSQAHMI